MSHITLPSRVDPKAAAAYLEEQYLSPHLDIRLEKEQVLGNCVDDEFFLPMSAGGYETPPTSTTTTTKYANAQTTSNVKMNCCFVFAIVRLLL